MLHLCADKEEALEVASQINPGDVVLVKASRSEKLEEVAEAISVMWLEKMKESEELA
jgi:UDP-N-acetylmuramoyl-tripeptide--D-alanyl-D-alanine ligase